MSGNIFAAVVVPVASPEDAAATCESLRSRIADDVGRAIFVHVIEKAGGAPDKASVEQREEYANDVADTVAASLEDTDVSFDIEVRFGTDIVETVRNAADDLDATAIVFAPRASSRWVRLISGDTAYSLIAESDVPVVSLPVSGGAA